MLSDIKKLLIALVLETVYSFVKSKLTILSTSSLARFLFLNSFNDFIFRIEISIILRLHIYLCFKALIRFTYIITLNLENKYQSLLGYIDLYVSKHCLGVIIYKVINRHIHYKALM